MKAMLTAAALAWLAAAVCGASADERWATYVNDRFGTSLSYPADVLVMQPPPENDDGRTLVAADGGKILVFGGYNVDGRNAGVETRLAHRPRLCVRRLQCDRQELVRRLGQSRDRRGQIDLLREVHRFGAVGDDPQPDRHLPRRSQGALRPDRRARRCVVRRPLTP